MKSGRARSSHRSAPRFDVLVTTPELVSLHRAYDLSERQLLVPSTAFDGVSAGSRVLWRVIAVTPDGRSTSSAGFQAVLQ